VKPGRNSDFIEANRRADLDRPGLRRGSLIKTGERTSCIIGEWDSMDAIVTARDAIVAILGTYRGTLEDFGDGLGVTDPVSGECILDVRH
jgi:hypothetical protein